jgi:eukaryotic-like serine/threonine-protein kinase
MFDVESLVGKQIDQFRLDQFIAKGAMGMVYKASDTFLNRIVALKLIPKDVDVGPGMEEARKRLLQEARAASRLAHPNIVTIHSYGETAEFQYICMEYIIGRTLAQVLHEQRVLPVEEVLAIFGQILLALEVAGKEHIVHRDIKPTNIMIMEGKRVKVMDFGVAKIPSLSITTTGTVLGTPFYMSPEQISGQKVDIRSDIFSVGVILYQALTGERPFEGESTVTLAYKIVQVEPIPPKVLNVHVPQYLENICRKALAKDPVQRYQTPAEMLRDLKAAHKKAPSEETDGTTVKSQILSSAVTMQVKKAPPAPEPPRRAPTAPETPKVVPPAKPPQPTPEPEPKPAQAAEPKPAPEPEPEPEPKAKPKPVTPSPKVQPPPQAQQPSSKVPPTAAKTATSYKPLAVISVLLLFLVLAVLVYIVRSNRTIQPSLPSAVITSPAPLTSVTPPAGGAPVPSPTTVPPSGTVAPPSAPAQVPAPAPAPAQTVGAAKATIDALIGEAKNQVNSNPAAAQGLLEKAVSLDPTSFDAIYQLARVLTFRQNFPAAIQQYQNALNLNNKFPDIFFNLGYIYMAQQNYDMAISNYESCWALSPPYKDEVLTNLGICHLKKNNPTQAQLLFRQALEMNPNNEVARSYLKSMGG